LSMNKSKSIPRQKTRAMVENITVIGLLRGEKIYINPLIEDTDIQIIKKHDQLIFIAEDDSEGVLEMLDSPSKHIIDTAVFDLVYIPSKLKKILILGWNENGHEIINNLFCYMHEESEILIAADNKNFENHTKTIQPKKGIIIKTVFVKCDTTKHAALEQIKPDTFDSILILGYLNLGVQERDAKTLITLFHIRRIIERIIEEGNFNKETNIVTEISDDRNRKLAEISRAYDFIVSDNIVSSMVAQLSRAKELKRVFDILFDIGGREIYLNPIDRYIDHEVEVNFSTIIKSAANKKEIAIGYRKIDEADRPNKYSIYLNPDKLKNIKFNSKDKVIVIS